MYNMTPVTSSNVKAVGYDGNDLIVDFNDGSRYRYYGAASHYKGAISAESVGKYLNENVKGSYSYKKEN